MRRNSFVAICRVQLLAAAQALAPPESTRQCSPTWEKMRLLLLAKHLDTNVVTGNRRLTRFACSAIGTRIRGEAVAHVRLKAAGALSGRHAFDGFGAARLRILRYAAHVSVAARLFAIGGVVACHGERARFRTAGRR